LYFFSPLARFLGAGTRARLPILMYHSVSENLFGKAHPYYHINTSPRAFSEQMRWLRHEGFHTLSLSEAWGRIGSGLDLSHEIVITFDHGYRDFYTEAMEIMKQCGFTATVFLPTGRIRNRTTRIEGADYLTWSEVRTLHKEGISFGSHTVTHADLRSLELDQIEYELGHSKDVIEQNLGAKIDSFSYPYAFPEEDKNFVRFLGDVMENLEFEYGVSSILGRACGRSHRFFLPRLPVNDWDDSALLGAKVDGGYDWLHWPQLLKKIVLHNSSLTQSVSRTKAMKAQT
jgi:peptidoglycan/xylan/chitin deacetylase (PgdA/CDA1 family)